MWIIFNQTSSGRVRFLTSEMDTPSSMEYWKFLKFLQETYKARNFPALREHLDSFETLVVLNTGEWEVKLPEEARKDASFFDLVELNKDDKDAVAYYENLDSNKKVEFDLMSMLEAKLKNKDFSKLGNNSQHIKSNFFNRLKTFKWSYNNEKK